jgi:hypothetical protein
MSTPDEQREQLQKWLTGIKIYQMGHLIAASFYSKRSRIFGLIVVIFSAVVSAVRLAV